MKKNLFANKKVIIATLVLIVLVLFVYEKAIGWIALTGVGPFILLLLCLGPCCLLPFVFLRKTFSKKEDRNCKKNHNSNHCDCGEDSCSISENPKP